MPNDVKSVHLPQGTVELLQEILRDSGEKTVNMLMVKFILLGIEQFKKPAALNTIELEALKASHAEALATAQEGYDDLLRAANSVTETLQVKLEKAEQQAADAREENVRVAESLGQTRLVVEELHRHLEDALRANDEKFAKVTENLKAANRRADDQEQHAMELEQELTMARADKAAAEALFAEADGSQHRVEIAALRMELTSANDELTVAKDTITDLTSNLEKTVKERDDVVGAKAGVPVAVYEKLLKQAQRMAHHMEHAVMLPPQLFYAMEVYTDRQGGKAGWRRYMVMLLNKALEDARVIVEPGWGADVEVDLPLIPPTLPKAAP